MFDSRAAKKSYSSDRSASCGTVRPARSTPPAKPYQPGSMKRACDQLNTQGMARRSSMRRLAVREAGRLPMLSWTISPMGVADQKKSVKPGVS